MFFYNLNFSKAFEIFKLNSHLEKSSFDLFASVSQHSFETQANTAHTLINNNAQSFADSYKNSKRLLFPKVKYKSKGRLISKTLTVAWTVYVSSPLYS